MNIIDINGDLIDIENNEIFEQNIIHKYILENDIVLVLGGRYGLLSCIINAKLNNKNNQVVVEPDYRIWNVLEENKKRNNCEFNIVKGFISYKKLDLTNLYDDDGYGSTYIENNNSQIPSFTLNEINEKYNLKFNVIVSDCEGFLENFLNEYPDICNNLRLIIYEVDYITKYKYNLLYNILFNKNFLKITVENQNIWIK